jgi:hypothetical protein
MGFCWLLYVYLYIDILKTIAVAYMVVVACPVAYSQFASLQSLLQKMRGPVGGMYIPYILVLKY